MDNLIKKDVDNNLLSNNLLTNDLLGDNNLTYIDSDINIDIKTNY